MSRLLTVKDAINEALRQEMERDETVFLMGEDIAGGAGRDHEGALDSWGGPFGVTKGLVRQFGRKRVIDTPIAETGFIGMAVGAAFAGLRPIPEMMYVDFLGVCLDQMFNQAAKLRYMYGGKVNIPLVLRTVVGAGFRAGGEHSQTMYPVFTHIPGLKVIAPADAYDAKGLLIAAIRDNDPVVYMEHKRLYMRKTEVPEEPYVIPLGKAKVKRQGTDVTIIAIQKMVEYAMNAAAELEKEGISVEIVDPRTLSPLDTDTMAASIRKTRRCVIVDESYPRCGMAADISATLTEQVWDVLKCPIRRVTPPHTPIPFSPPLEDEWMPREGKIMAAVKEVLAQGSVRA